MHLSLADHNCISTYLTLYSHIPAVPQNSTFECLPVVIATYMYCVDSQVAPLPKDLLDRRVEITGPVDRKMVINALNSGASVFMADFEDSNAPLW